MAGCRDLVVDFDSTQPGPPGGNRPHAAVTQPDSEAPSQARLARVGFEDCKLECPTLTRPRFSVFSIFQDSGNTVAGRKLEALAPSRLRVCGYSSR